MLDNTDKAILRELQKDSSISNLDLSKKVGLSPSACLARTKNLIETGVIKNFVAIVDEKKLGMEILAFTTIDLTPSNRDTIRSFLKDVKKLPQVQECYTITGSHNYLLKIVAKDMHSYHDFIVDSIMQNSAVSKIETVMVLKVDKRDTNVPADEGAMP